MTSDQSDKAEPVTNGGSITVGAHDIQSLDLNWWRRQIGLVQQEPFAFNDTIYKNVAYGLVGSRWENEDDETKRALVEEACKEAFADEFISRLPSVCLMNGVTVLAHLTNTWQGYETMVGENGIKLSGGQRQRSGLFP